MDPTPDSEATIKALQADNASLRAEVNRLHDNLKRLSGNPDDRLKKAAEIYRLQVGQIQLLEDKLKTASAFAATQQLSNNDLKDAVKGFAWFLLIEMEDGVRSVTVFNDPSVAQKEHTASNAKVAFLCAVLNGPMVKLDLIKDAWVATGKAG